MNSNAIGRYPKRKFEREGTWEKMVVTWTSIGKEEHLMVGAVSKERVREPGTLARGIIVEE